ncbi:MAG: hypothetical protein ACRDPJ_04135 [Nocardioidaceae bacterium]
MSLTSLILAAAETHSEEPAVPAWAVGAVAFGVLLVLLFGLLMFGKGRDHS